MKKPKREDAPSTWRSSAVTRHPRYFEALAATVSDRTGEIQLTNGLRHLLQKRPVYVCEIDGVRHDTGNKNSASSRRWSTSRSGGPSSPSRFDATLKRSN